MNPDTYKCFSVGFGIFMLVWMLGALQSSSEGANAKTMQTGEGRKEIWVPRGQNVHLYHLVSMLPLINEITEDELQKVNNNIREEKYETVNSFGATMTLRELKNKIRGIVAARFIIVIGEMFMVLISILVLGRRVTGSSKSFLEAGACGMLAFGCLVCGSIESWFASGKAMGSYIDRYNEILATTDGWISAAAFLFLGFILWIVNAVVAVMNPISDTDSRGYGGSNTNIAGNFQPQMGYPPYPPPMHQPYPPPMHQ